MLYITHVLNHKIAVLLFVCAGMNLNLRCMTTGEQVEGRGKGTEGWQQICYVEAHCLFSQSDITRMMNSGSCKR
jgi:uncharacterized protein YraI